MANIHIELLQVDYFTVFVKLISWPKFMYAYCIGTKCVHTNRYIILTYFNQLTIIINDYWSSCLKLNKIY